MSKETEITNSKIENDYSILTEICEKQENEDKINNIVMILRQEEGQ